MTHTDLSYLYGVVSELSSAMTVMLMASWFASELTKRKRVRALQASISTTVLGFELERLLPGGVSQSFAYDNIGRLVDSKTRRSAEQRRSRHCNWGSADRLLLIEDARYGLTQYSYSPSGELTMA